MGYGLKYHLPVRSSLTHSDGVISSSLYSLVLIEWKLWEGKNLSDVFDALSPAAGT